MSADVSLLDLSFVLVVLVLLMVVATWIARLIGAMQPVGGARNTELDPELVELLDKKAHLLEDLRDLELDYKMGKVNEHDYRTQRARLEPEAVKVIKALEARGANGPAEDDDDDDDDDDE